MDLTPHSNEWYDRLSRLQEGYFYPWKSRIAPGDGESTFVQLVMAHLGPDKDVLDAGCGHGELTLKLAPKCRFICGYDRVAEYIRLADRAAEEMGITNANFILADSSPRSNHGSAMVPADDNSVDLIISRRGPLNWIPEARRVCRRGGAMIQLNPSCSGAPRWMEELPASVQKPMPLIDLEQRIKQDLASAGLHLYSYWRFCVPEWFNDPRELYVWLTWGNDPAHVPPYDSVSGDIAKVFKRHARPQGLAVPHERFLWKATLE